CWQLAAGKGRVRRWLALNRSGRQPPEKSQVIKHYDVKYCMVMSCVGGEVTSPYGAIKGRSSAS
ncbi:MAG: hypothetical protein ACO1QS_19350, partial [Verrucomicrobiota bacterium]